MSEVNRMVVRSNNTIRNENIETSLVNEDGLLRVRVTIRGVEPNRNIAIAVILLQNGRTYATSTESIASGRGYNGGLTNINREFEFVIIGSEGDSYETRVVAHYICG
ncbi:hypothetical protein [Cellulosilyticum ruminicola]|uniref:hypothetical protein n=1 Tax=Cellulosilyticum ruminicola TaxID=425254 RepID=UPI0006CF73F6|nr:hypothetical protein [Cellulosilyticum ruminicola]